MPTLPNMTLPSNSIDATEIYENGLFAPANPPKTAEILNGGMEQVNYNGGANSIKPYMMDMGTFARGYSASFSRREFVYAKQLNSNFDNQPIAVCGLSTRIFLPFECRCIQYGWQAWFNHDASAYQNEAGATTNYEFWRYKFSLLSHTSNSAVTAANAALTGRLPYGRQLIDENWNENSGNMEEARWYYVHKTGLLSTTISRGYYDFSLEISANIIRPPTQGTGSGAPAADRNDQFLAKNKILSGTIWVLALR